MTNKKGIDEGADRVGVVGAGWGDRSRLTLVSLEKYLYTILIYVSCHNS